jgi:hypothetical protein
MLLQTNSYIVPKERRSEHARLLQRFRQTLARLGCDHFEAYEQVGVNWGGGEPTGRFVQIMRFRDKAHQQNVQNAEKNDPAAQALIREFCELINFPYQQQQGLFAVGFYNSVLPITHPRAPKPPEMHRATDAPASQQDGEPHAVVGREVSSTKAEASDEGQGDDVSIVHDHAPGAEEDAVAEDDEGPRSHRHHMN